jgi:hypothetical protein
MIEARGDLLDYFLGACMLIVRPLEALLRNGNAPELPPTLRHLSNPPAFSSAYVRADAEVLKALCRGLVSAMKFS